MILSRVARLSCAVAALALMGSASAADAAKEIAALEAVDQAWAKAYNSANADAIAALYDEQAVLLPPGSPPVSGRAAIKAFFAKDTAESQKAGVTFILDPKPAGGVSGDMGWQSGTYTAKDKSGKVLETGKYLSVSKKKAGKWLYVRDTWNADAAPQAAAPAPAPVAPTAAPAAAPKK
ncbi:MAG: DUF4440 domain-containing protein [Burkholderiales bacterium]